MKPPNTRRDFLKHSAAAAALGLAGRAKSGDAPIATHYICVTCGMQFAATPQPSAHCPICEDERQYVGHAGQQWTTLREYRRTHKNVFAEEEPNLHTILPEPKAGIGQRAFLVRTGDGNVLWDCVPPLDDATIKRVTALGGIQAIAISHPHYYTTMVEWSRALGGVPIYLHAADRQWVTRADPAVQFWEGDTKPIGPGLTLVRLGGHFDGGTV